MWQRKQWKSEEMEDVRRVSLAGSDFAYERLPITIQLSWDRQGRFVLDDVASRTGRQRLYGQRKAVCEWVARAWEADPKAAVGDVEALEGYLEWRAEAYGDSPALTCKECCFDLSPRQLWKRGLELCAIYPDTRLEALEFSAKGRRYARFGKAARI